MPGNFGRTDGEGVQVVAALTFTVTLREIATTRDPVLTARGVTQGGKGGRSRVQCRQSFRLHQNVDHRFG